ncbi:hypothetical protein SAPIO_CDS3202 [Scedosporium apiospermum]|uniref:DUF7707 domain-containing protein n=1 Tax=Pseudallescheria apiosperma TaxID=563466 RepID=A0A084GA94_PSEDA|nr:uncharacterized protein SAPIO_CDS3202 [Scedosporium apiospermum]KEZ44256.1 hypothetical protein SAPIO_CDS3202 [Scedosporium apiospermum]
MRSLVSIVMALGLASAATITDFNVDPNSVAIRDRGAWCMGERNTCEALCPGAAKENKCDINTLDYTCTCNNGTEPGLKYYSASLYSFVCQEAFKQCTERSAGDPVELPKCETDIQAKCGTLDASKLPTDDEDTSTPTESSASSPTPSDSSSGSNGSEDSSSGDNKEGAAASVFVGTSAVAVAIGMFAVLL